MRRRWVFAALLLFVGDLQPRECWGNQLNSTKNNKPGPCRKVDRDYVHNDARVVEGANFIYVPMRKTGSRYITKVLKRYGGFACHGTGEGFFRPKEVRGRKVIGSTRNPYDGYVSLWSYGRQGKGALHSKLTGLRYGSDDAASFQGWINGLLNIAGHSHGAHGTLDFADMREFDIGLETSRYINIYAQRRFQEVLQGEQTLHTDRWIECCEDLDGEIERAMAFANTTLENNTAATVSTNATIEVANATRSRGHNKEGKRALKRNTSKHNPWQAYFDNKTMCLVQYKDRWVFEFFKFDFLVDPKACEAMGEKVHKSGDPMIVANGDGGWTGRAGPSLSSTSLKARMLPVPTNTKTCIAIAVVTCSLALVGGITVLIHTCKKNLWLQENVLHALARFGGISTAGAGRNSNKLVGNINLFK